MNPVLKESNVNVWVKKELKIDVPVPKINNKPTPTIIAAPM